MTLFASIFCDFPERNKGDDNSENLDFLCLRTGHKGRSVAGDASRDRLLLCRSIQSLEARHHHPQQVGSNLDLMESRVSQKFIELHYHNFPEDFLIFQRKKLC